MKRIIKAKEGITLIALVVTIIVLLILAGVTITVLFGDHGIFKTTQNAGLQTKLGELEEKANIAYAHLNTKKYEEGNPSKIITMEDIKQELEKQKYHIEQIQPDKNAIIGIELEPNTIKMSKNETKEINIIYKRNENLEYIYYAEVDGKYYKIALENNQIVLDKINGKTKEELKGNTQTIMPTATSNSEIVTVGNITENKIIIQSGESTGTAEITVAYGDVEPQKCKIVVILKPIEGSTDLGNNFFTNYGRVDIVWLNEKNEIISEPNAPVLGKEGNKMKPIKWNGETEAIANEANQNHDWYHYEAREDLEENTNSHWANAKTENGSYFVWVPRYAYRITYYENETSTQPTGYYDGHGMWRDSDGKKKFDLEDGVETVEDEDGYLYIVHPAFGTTAKEEADKTNNINLGGWGESISGFWFAKFEMSGSSGTYLQSVPGVQSIRSQKVGDYYTSAREANYGQVGEEDPLDNNTSFMHSHMAKNSEWGAVIFLAHSKYGRNGQKVSAESDDYGTPTGGGSGADAYKQANNQKQSTTGNVYGVYDMTTGAAEYTATYNFYRYAQYLEQGESFTSKSNSKYAMGCSYYANGSDGYGVKYWKQASIIGDAMFQVIKNYGPSTGEAQSWHGVSMYPSYMQSYFLRGYGGNWFCVGSADGRANQNDACSFRAVLTP